ncbi:MAG: hypothetical protein E3K37_01565 [Candidatus Kuenenia sp.]|nr:hypothetical protein [Candidatus Kuenenia hertensis]
MITKKELLEKLAGEGIKVTDSMLTHFITLGLIKKPMRYGLGKGKGSVSEFDDRVFNEIKQIMKLHDEGLTYEQIKHKRMSSDEWLSLVRQIKESSKSEDDASDSIKKLPYLANWEKGRLKLISDMAENLTRIFTSELSVMLAPFANKSEDDLYDDAYEVIESYLDDLFYTGGIGWEGWEEELEEYLEGKKSYTYFSPTGLHGPCVGSLGKKTKGEKKDKKSGKGGKQKNGKND